MDKKYTIEILEEEAAIIRASYRESEGTEWVRLVITLKALIEEYASEKQYDKVVICSKEVDEVLSKVQVKKILPLDKPKHSESLNAYYGEISEWAKKVELCRSDLGEGGSFTNYANSIIALCGYLRLARQQDIALVKYEEAIQILLSSPLENEKHEDRIYTTILLFLNASISAHEIGDEKLSKRYGVYSLLYLVENADINDWGALMNRDYIVELCNNLIKG